MISDESKWVAAVLANDENSTDEELVAYLMKEAPMSKQRAMDMVAVRDLYLRGDVQGFLDLAFRRAK